MNTLADWKPVRLPHREKFDRLVKRLRAFKRVVVAYSGGVDSTLVMEAGTMALGADCIGVIARSESLTDFEYAGAMSVARDHGFCIQTIEYSELADEHYTVNAPDRCYFCKRELMDRLWTVAREVGAEAIAEGSNADDAGDWRPGLRALEEMRVISPLREAGLTKQEIRDLAHALNLPNWDKPSAPCLSSRIAYGITIDREKLNQVALGEAFLREHGFKRFRVRHHGDIARVEVEAEEIGRLMESPLREALAARLREVGFLFVTVDLEGFRSGSLNQAIAGTAPAVR